MSEPATDISQLLEEPDRPVALPALAALPESAAETTADGDLARLLDVPVEVSVEIGRTTMTIRQALEIGPGSVIALDRLTGEPVDLLVNGRKIARGEVVAIDEEFGLRITQVVPPDQREAA